MTKTRRQILNDAARSLSMLIRRNSMNMEPMTADIVKIHELHLRRLKELLDSDGQKTDSELNHKWED